MDESTETSPGGISAEWEHLTPHEREVIEGVLRRISIPRDANKEFSDRRTLGQRASDAIAAFGGSWTFILLFGAGLVSWAVLNAEYLGPMQRGVRPLSLHLPQPHAVDGGRRPAPIIKVSQKRQEARDRLEAEVDHEVNVRAPGDGHSPRR